MKGGEIAYGSHRVPGMSGSIGSGIQEGRRSGGDDGLLDGCLSRLPMGDWAM